MTKPRIGPQGLAVSQPPYTARGSGLLSTAQICCYRIHSYGTVAENITEYNCICAMIQVNLLIGHAVSAEVSRLFELHASTPVLMAQ